MTLAGAREWMLPQSVRLDSGCAGGGGGGGLEEGQEKEGGKGMMNGSAG